MRMRMHDKNNCRGWESVGGISDSSGGSRTEERRSPSGQPGAGTRDDVTVAVAGPGKT